jgi:UDP-N-acetylmuramate dehydrogenase
MGMQNTLTLNEKLDFYLMMTEKNSQYKGKFRTNELMSRHTSWRVGGPADQLYIPYDYEDLRNFLTQLEKSESLTWIGLGSNLLVRDGGIRGTVIATKNMDEKIEKLSSTNIFSGAGISCAQLAKASVKFGLSGAEFLIGIPGTIGGALAMNAGAFGLETWDVIESVTTINRDGIAVKRVKDEFVIGYRSVKIPDGEWFVSANLKLLQDTVGNGKEIIKDLLSQRSESQPIGEASCGSVFKNPEIGDPAAKLIDDCGLKGFSVGGAAVSTKHANFIINEGNATAENIESLINQVQMKVLEKFSIKLIPEVRIVGVRQNLGADFNA